MHSPVSPHRIRTLHRVRCLTAAGVFTIGLVVASGAWALPAVPPSVAPGQVEKRLAPEQRPSDRLQLNVPSPVESQAIPDELRKKLESTRFLLKQVDLEGATLYQADDLLFAFNEYIGSTISLLDAREIASRITAHYRSNGYVLSQAVVPVQEVENGKLKIRVVEGFIGSVTYVGDESSSGELARLNAYADKIKALRPASMEQIERYMLLMNDLSGSSVTGLIRASATEFGAADLVLTVRHKEFDAGYTFDNRGSKSLGPWQHTAVVAANSLFGMYDRTQLRVMTAMPFRQLLLSEFQHDQFLGSEGTKLSFVASHTTTRPGDNLKDLRIVGDSALFQLRISHPFIRLRQQTLVGRASFDVRNSAVDVFKDVSLTRDRLRVARLGGTYAFLDTMMGVSSVDVQLSQGLNIFEATSDKGVFRSNPLGDSSFTKVNFDLSRQQALGSGFSILTAATGQFSFQPLMSDEQFSLGGSEYGRAFDPSETMGDSGLAGKMELRFDDSIGEPYFDSYQLFGAFDIGETWKRGTGSSRLASDSLASVGVGTRLRFNEYLSSSVEANVPVMRPNDDSTRYRHNPRIFFSLSARF